MSLYKNLFKQTAIYGLATVVPRIMSVILTPLYVYYLTDKSKMGEVTIIFSWLVFFNVVLSYGMETSFFRFYNSDAKKEDVVSTSMISLLGSTLLFVVLGLLFQQGISNITRINTEYIAYTIGILALDALVIIPFSKLRAESRPIKYAVIKIANVGINLGLNIFFLVILPEIAANSAFFQSIYSENFQVGYIFVSNLIASSFTLLVLLPDYFKLNWNFDKQLWERMLRYGFPILIAGIAFAINEHFDKILLEWMNISLSDIGAYSACYKIGMFMVLFRTAYTLGIEPFFFSHAKNENAPQTYAEITKYFVIFGSFMALGVIVFADVLKIFLVPKSEYWTAMDIVPIIVMANFFLGIYTNLSVWYKLIDKTKIGAYISVIGAIVTLVFNFLFIPKMSYLGSAIATILAYGTMMLISYKLGQKQYPIPYDKKKIGMYLGLSIVLSGFSFYVPILRQTYIFGIISLIIFAYFVYRNERELVLKLIKRK
ncbi:polysaccharide biosynthesis C-terminal domain-containing protein [Flavobacterium sp. NRK F10]|uniref:Polysaccharide biosynthesis protein n=1 Tax=Flavobacterium sediminis TaxID=2201181 RepID=A0A2U8QUA1_9FLAO|nr:MULTISPECIES: polysaccharide biosynthesis C-terminal domain-containing protein [Flavobacterium]AWM13780.1 polysaccharide biosynthesis protein [Flavobacterium sediminis]MCO6174940.1 polysaccharide biosynthesis C-terminal domain-containing protein [Flavobacterium sp. NRK F10]